MHKLFKILLGFMILFSLIIPSAIAEVKLQGITETAYQECGDLGNDALAIQSIRYELNSSKQEIMDALDVLVKAELGLQPLFMRRINAIATWVFHNYPADFSPGLVGQTYAVECRIKIAQQIELLVNHDELIANHEGESENRKSWVISK